MPGPCSNNVRNTQGRKSQLCVQGRQTTLAAAEVEVRRLTDENARLKERLERLDAEERRRKEEAEQRLAADARPGPAPAGELTAEALAALLGQLEAGDADAVDARLVEHAEFIAALRRKCIQLQADNIALSVKSMNQLHRIQWLERDQAAQELELETAQRPASPRGRQGRRAFRRASRRRASRRRRRTRRSSAPTAQAAGYSGAAAGSGSGPPTAATPRPRVPRLPAL
jgi:hypothetical protein